MRINYRDNNGWMTRSYTADTIEDVRPEHRAYIALLDAMDTNVLYADEGSTNILAYKTPPSGEETHIYWITV